MKYKEDKFRVIKHSNIKNEYSCGICFKQISKNGFFYEVDNPYPVLQYHWGAVCSEECINMFILSRI
jgi:hypothetical protein